MKSIVQIFGGVRTIGVVLVAQWMLSACAGLGSVAFDDPCLGLEEGVPQSQACIDSKEPLRICDVNVTQIYANAGVGPRLLLPALLADASYLNRLHDGVMPDDQWHRASGQFRPGLYLQVIFSNDSHADLLLKRGAHDRSPPVELPLLLRDVAENRWQLDAIDCR